VPRTDRYLIRLVQTSGIEHKNPPLKQVRRVMRFKRLIDVAKNKPFFDCTRSRSSTRCSCKP
jgi:hypothetical protein